jgi:hypothetical protein
MLSRRGSARRTRCERESHPTGDAQVIGHIEVAGLNSGGAAVVARAREPATKADACTCGEAQHRTTSS